MSASIASGGSVSAASDATDPGRRGGGRPLHVSVMACPAFEAISRRSYRSISLIVFQGPIARGTFGSVHRAQLQETGEPVAVKRVFQDPRYKNRELLTFYKLGAHQNLVRLRYHYYCQGAKGPNDVFLHLVTELFPESLCALLTRHRIAGTLPSLLHVKAFTYQLLRAVNYMHTHRMCHRDIKSLNVLVDESDCRLRLCDLGSAKEMPSESVGDSSGGGASAGDGGGSVAYISSRYYRAPELLFGSTDYTCAIDLWSAGCVLAEMCIGYCLFMANNSLDQLVAIIRVLGTPTKRDLAAMNPVYADCALPQVAPDPHLNFPPGTPPELLDLLCRLLAYQPGARLRPLRALTHPFFQELRRPGLCRLPDGRPLPPLFDLTWQELSPEPALRPALLPEESAALDSAERETDPAIGPA